MLGKFAVVQRSLLPELLTGATPAPDSSSRQPGRALQLYTPHIEQGFLRMKLSFYLHCWVAMSGNMENCRVLRCWCGVARPGGGAACLAAGFMGVDVIRMHFKKIPSLILLFNFYIYIILLLEIDNSIIIGLKIMNLNILLLNF